MPTSYLCLVSIIKNTTCCYGDNTGGPGSGKGRILSQVQDTISNVELISTELLILDQLPHKVSNAIKLESTKDVTGKCMMTPVL